MVKRLYDIILLFKEYFLLALYIVISLFLLARNESDQIRAIRAQLLTIVGGMQSVLGFVPNYFTLRDENEVLREQNLTLTDEVSRLREARLENYRLRRLLALKEHPALPYLAARVVGATSQSLRNTITIDRGLKDGVAVNMPVVTADGLAGKISTVSNDYAVAQLLLHKDVRVSARVERSRVNGIIRWTGGRSLSFANVPTSLDVKKGDVIITSEFSSIFPAGIRIGVVSGQHAVPGELFQAIDVTPAVDFNRLEEVFVALRTPDSSRVAIEQRH
jgi:rod shape-determining protein MreC